MSKKKELLGRAYLVMGGLILLSMLLVGKTVKISILEGREWRSQGDSTKLKIVDIEAERGNIYSANGQLLATSIPLFDLHMDLNSEPMTQALFDKNVDSLAFYLSKQVFKGESPSAVKRRLIRRRNAGDRYFPIKRNATYNELKQIKSFPLIRLGKYRGGLVITQKSKRLRPYKSLARRTIGISRTTAPSVGLERTFDEYLRGEAGKKWMEKVGNRTWVPVRDLNEIEPKRGMNIHTTLDMRMQDIAHHALMKALNKHDAESGSVIIMDVASGAIKAISNLDRQKNGQFGELFNHAVGDAGEPGSTFKLASMMAMLEDKFISLDDSVDINHGRAYFRKQLMRDSEWHPYTNVTLRYAFEISSNVGIAKAVDLYYGKNDKAELFIEKLRQFGLHEKTGIEIFGEGTPIINDPDSPEWSKISLPWMSHGYALHITPLQTLAFYNAVANNGKKMKPYLVERIEDEGKVIRKFKPEVLIRHIASKETIHKAQELLIGVVERGTGAKLQSKHFDFAGKSGTTKLEYWENDGDNKYQASFVGYFPATNPVYSCIVVVKKPKKLGYYGGTVAGPVFKEIVEKCIATDIDLIEMAVNQDKTESFSGYPLYEAGYTSDIQKVFEFLRIEYEDRSDSEWSVVMPKHDDISLENRSVEEEIMPNVVGMGLRDALFILENLGLKVKINGFGKVKEQSLSPGTKIDGQKIMLYLS